MTRRPPDPFELEIDRFGRVLIPKRVREALNLRPGSRVHAVVSEGELRLVSPEPHHTVSHDAGGWPVVHLEQVDARTFDLEVRDDRSPEELAAWK